MNGSLAPETVAFTRGLIGGRFGTAVMASGGQWRMLDDAAVDAGVLPVDGKKMRVEYRPVNVAFHGTDEPGALGAAIAKTDAELSALLAEVLTAPTIAAHDGPTLVSVWSSVPTVAMWPDVIEGHKVIVGRASLRVVLLVRPVAVDPEAGAREVVVGPDSIDGPVALAADDPVLVDLGVEEELRPVASLPERKPGRTVIGFPLRRLVQLAGLADGRPLRAWVDSYHQGEEVLVLVEGPAGTGPYKAVGNGDLAERYLWDRYTGVSDELLQVIAGVDPAPGPGPEVPNSLMLDWWEIAVELARELSDARERLAGSW